MLVSTQTNAATTATAVSNASRASWSSYADCNESLAAKSAVRRGEQADEQDLTEEPRAVALSAHVIHASLVGTARPADKRNVAERILIVDDHPLTRDALAALLAQQGFDVVGEAEDGAQAIAEAADPAARPRAPRPDDARAWTG